MKHALIAILTLLTVSVKAALFSEIEGTVAYGQNTASGNNVYALCIGIPLNQYFSVGLIGANDGGRWLASAATIQLGGSYKVTDKVSLCANVASGMAYDIFTQRPTLYSFTDAGLDYKLSSNWTIGGKIVVANVADRAGVDVMGALSIGYKF